MISDEDKLHIERSAEYFSFRLKQFIDAWEPEDIRDRMQFREDMMRLFVDAMSHKTVVLSAGMNMFHSMADTFSQRATAPLHVIMQEPRGPK